MQEAKEEVRNRLAIEDVVSEYVQLKRAGKLWRGLSPFTNEKTPSFFVTPDRNIWHDFSSGRGGDVFAFIMEVEGLDFRGALEMLARKAGVDLSQYDNETNKGFADKKKRALEVNSYSKKYFQSEMVKSKLAQEYIFKKRGFTKDTVIDWEIGYAPADGGASDFLRSKGFTDTEIRNAGLIGGRGGNMFRDRMMIPLCDSQGQVVGFTGRIIGPGEPKYINTPATVLYDKGRQVFGLHLAKQAIRKEDFVVLTEGNLDVISSYQAGVKNVVACAGTALTIFHLKALNRLTSNIYLCFDGDGAGIIATERAILLAQGLNINLRVIDLPSVAKDPDELIQKGVVLWRDAIKRHKPAVQWVIDNYVSQVDLSSADGKKKLTTEAMKIVSKLNDPVEREHYLKELSKLTDTKIETLEQKMSLSAESTDIKRPLKTVKIEKDSPDRRNEQTLLMWVMALAQANKKLRTIIKNLPDEVLTEPMAKVKYYLLDENSVKMDSDLADKLAELELVAENLQVSDCRLAMLSFLRDIELSGAQRRRDQLMNDFVSVDDDDDQRREILNSAIKKLNNSIKLLKNTGPNDEFDGLFAIWDERRENVLQ